MVADFFFPLLLPSFFLLIQLKQTSVHQPGLWEEVLLSIKTIHAAEKAEMFEHTNSSYILHSAIFWGLNTHSARTFLLLFSCCSMIMFLSDSSSIYKTTFKILVLSSTISPGHPSNQISWASSLGIIFFFFLSNHQTSEVAGEMNPEWAFFQVFAISFLNVQKK